MNRFAVATIGALILALLPVAAASAKKPTPGTHGHKTQVSCSQSALVAAIDAANSNGGGTLKLAHGCHYALTTSPDSSENGLPAITSAITIKGDHSTIDGTDSFRVFEVDGPGGSLSARDLTITGGSAQDFGGGIANLGGRVTLDHARVIGNRAVSAGGGIASATFDPSSVAALIVRHSSVSHNQQTSADPDVALGGGGIVNIEGTAKLDHTQVSGNTAQGFVGGGIANGDYFNFSSSDSVLKLDHSRVNGNTAPNGNGGGIQNLLGSVTVRHTQVNGNAAVHGGGIVSGNANGGSAGPAELKLSHSEVNRNTATAEPPPPGEGAPVAAGGISNGSVAVLDHTRVDGNTASQTSGAGIVNHGTMTLRHSEVNRNTAAGSGAKASGGGILNLPSPGVPGTGVLTLDHSKVNRNTAGGNGGGISNGLAPMATGGDVTLKHSQVTHNSAAHGGGIFNNGGTVTLSHTSVTDNVVDNCEPTNTIAGCTN